MQRGLTGTWLPQSDQGRDFEAFVPHALPPNPGLEWSSRLISELTKATESTSRLDGAARLLPDLGVFLYTYIRKEAVLSSQIEGTQSSLSDLLLAESDVTPGVPLDDVAEVSRYVQALNEGIRRIRAKEKISLQMILDMHRILLSTGRGSDKDPGKLRESQNWIGGPTPDRARFVPPPPPDVFRALENLFQYIESSEDQTLIKAALAHVQFETIHPFRDGNGRIGRLLITLILCQEGLISEPLVYLSLYLKENRDEYYNQLQSIRKIGDWENWLSFFLKGITEVTQGAFGLTKDIQHLFEEDLELIRSKGGRKARGMLELYRAFQQSPVLTVPRASEILGDVISKPTLYAAASELAELGILTSKIGEQSIQFHTYNKYLALLTK